MNPRQCTRRHDKTAIWLTRERRKCALDLTGLANVNRSGVHPKRRSHRLDRAPLADSRGVGRIADYRYTRDVRRYLLKKLQPFRAYGVLEHDETGGVAAQFRRSRALVPLIPSSHSPIHLEPSVWAPLS